MDRAKSKQWIKQNTLTIWAVTYVLYAIINYKNISRYGIYALAVQTLLLFFSSSVSLWKTSKLDEKKATAFRSNPFLPLEGKARIESDKTQLKHINNFARRPGKKHTLLSPIPRTVIFSINILIFCFSVFARRKISCYSKSEFDSPHTHSQHTLCESIKV